MNPHDPRQVLCSLLGITLIDLAVPCQILKLSPYERNPAAIEQAARVCFARVQAAQHFVHAEHLQWMMQVIADARNSMLNAAAALPPPGHFQQAPPPSPAFLPPPAPWASQIVTPSPHAANPPAAEPTEPPIVIRAPRPRRRSGFDTENLSGTIGALLMCGLIVFGVGMFVREWWKGMQDLPIKTEPGLPTGKPVQKRPPVRPGEGEAARSGSGNRAEKPDEGNPLAPVVPPSDDERAARENLKRAMKLAGDGSFDEGILLAQRASRVMPDESEGLMLMIDYVQQYSDLADAAQRALNGSTEVDLGKEWGKAQFVGQDSGSITFFAKGKHERFTMQQFKGITGVRFRLTRDYLDRANNPANDLIIGSYEVLMRVNESGFINVPGSRDAARKRFRNAIESGTPQMVEHGNLMIKATDFLKD